MNLRRWWRGLRRKVATWLRAAATRADPGWTLAPVTTGRVRRFKELLIDCGLAEAYEAAQAGANGAPAPGTGGPEAGPMSAAEQALGDAQASATGETPDGIGSEDAKTIRQGFVAEGRLEELNRIILDLPRPEMASEVPTDVVVVALQNFIPAYARHTAVLLGTAGATESA